MVPLAVTFRVPVVVVVPKVRAWLLLIKMPFDPVEEETVPAAVKIFAPLDPIAPVETPVERLMMPFAPAFKSVPAV